VSGDSVVLGGGEATRRLLGALKALAEALGTECFALIGGLAVMARLGDVHRATEDIDTAVVQVDDRPPAVSVLLSSASGPEEGTIAGVKVDSIEVGSVPAADIAAEDLPEDEFDRAFIVAHRWAFDTATGLTLAVEGGVGSAASCRVARPAALVAMKLQSAPRRREVRAYKGSNDYLDIFRLVSHVGLSVSIAEELRGAPHGLGAWCGKRIRTELVEDAARTASKIHRGPTGYLATPEDLRQAAIAFLERLGRLGDETAGEGEES
jgi:NAD(P)-dependent dehydrogenase (short-subunit alcohol dehydrogenase family)